MQVLQELCDNAGVLLEFLPPYSPDFNPIEEAFAEMKAWMRKNWIMAEAMGTYEQFLELALQQQVYKPGAHFRSCHIPLG
jgi:DDE superfamily endonuclease